MLDALDDSGTSRHAGYEDRDARRARRQARLAKAGKAGGLAARSSRVQANPTCVYLRSIRQFSMRDVQRRGVGRPTQKLRES